ncbi:MAG: pseudouridine synthase [Candidatus Saccharimonadales bacterium]
MRINQFIAASTELSRRAADAAVAAGRVKINGRPVTLGQSVASTDPVTLDDAPIAPRPNHTYILVNKPAGFVSSRVRQGEDPTVYDLLPPQFRTLRLAGRLDRDSCGLIILSDDGDFIQAATHPSAGKSKRYEITLESPIDEAGISKLKQGVILTDGLSRVEIVRATGKRLTVELDEGRNRQLRRTFGALGYTIIKLRRTSIGIFELGSLPSGKWREIDEQGRLK